MYIPLCFANTDIYYRMNFKIIAPIFGITALFPILPILPCNGKHDDILETKFSLNVCAYMIAATCNKCTFGAIASIISVLNFYGTTITVFGKRINNNKKLV